MTGLLLKGRNSTRFHVFFDGTGFLTHAIRHFLTIILVTLHEFSR